MDPIPDPTQNSASGLSFVTNTPAPPGTLFFPSPSNIHQGGEGEFIPNGTGGIPASTTLSIIATIMANNTGPQSWTGNVPGNPALNLPFSIQVNTCPSITAGTAAFSGCSNSLTGNLNPFVTGGSPPYTFSAAGTSTCPGTTIDIFGNFSFTAPTGFSGPCSFQYSVFDSFGCTSPIGTVFLTVREGPTAIPSLLITCENQSFIGGTLGVSGGTPPYTFAIVTNGAKDTATITNSATGTFNYVPNLNATGADSFTFQVTDSTGCVSDIATVNVTINVNPTTSTASLTGCVNGSLTGNNSFVTGANPPFTFGPTGSPVGGTVTINPSGLFNFTTSPGFSGPGSFEYQVTDTNGCVGTGLVDVTVSLPIAGNTAVSDCVNGSISGSLASLVTFWIPSLYL